MNLQCFVRTLLLSGVILPTAFCAGAGADWPQYRGPNGDGVSQDSTLPSWPAEGPKRLWRVPTSAGLSSFTAGGGKVFTVVARNVGEVLSEVCVALDADTGKEIWAVPTGIVKYPGGGDSGAEGNQGGDGPRSTPTVSAGRVYVYSAEMVLHCLEAGTGKGVWKRDILTDFGGRNISWKSAMSPVIDGDLLYVAGGGAGKSMLALNKTSGAVVWNTGEEKMTHATPVVATIGGVRQVIYLMQSGLMSVEAGSGKPLWHFPFPFKTCTACSPVVAGDIVFCTAGYEVGGAACQIVKDGGTFEAKELWRIKGNNAVASLWSTPVAKDGYLYGMLSFKKFGRGPLKCVDLKTGAVKWEQPGFGTGQVVLAGNHLIALADDGRLALVEATPAAYNEVASFRAIEGKCWSTPALSNGRLYVRSTKEGACFAIGAAPDGR